MSGARQANQPLSAATLCHVSPCLSISNTDNNTSSLPLRCRISLLNDYCRITTSSLLLYTVFEKNLYSPQMVERTKTNNNNTIVV